MIFVTLWALGVLTLWYLTYERFLKWEQILKPGMADVVLYAFCSLVLSSLWFLWVPAVVLFWVSKFIADRPLFDRIRR